MIVEVKVPNVGESVTEVTVGKFLVTEGTIVKMDDSLCELESDKSNFELPAEASGRIHFLVKEGDDLPIGAAICTIDTEAAANTTQNETNAGKQELPSTEPQAKIVVTENSNYATGHPSPAALKLLEENKLAAENIEGTGRNGRVTKDDVVQQAAKIQQQQTTILPTTENTAQTDAPLPPTASGRSEHREKMSRLRKTISKRLVDVKNNTAMLTTFNEADMTAIFDLRKKYKEVFEKKYGIGLGFMSLFGKAVALALHEFPMVNAYIIDDYIEYHDYVDISIAVSTDKGLVVPVVRNVENMGLHDIELAIKDLATKARNNTLSPDDMSGGTFTITNGGIFGSLLSTPIINPPQSAILGMHSIQERPVAIAGQVLVRPMMYLALSYDHRIIDGKEAVSFLVRVKQYLEDPIRLMLNV